MSLWKQLGGWSCTGCLARWRGCGCHTCTAVQIDGQASLCLGSYRFFLFHQFDISIIIIIVWEYLDVHAEYRLFFECFVFGNRPGTEDQVAYNMYAFTILYILKERKSR